MYILSVSLAVLTFMYPLAQRGFSKYLYTNIAKTKYTSHPDSRPSPPSVAMYRRIYSINLDVYKKKKTGTLGYRISVRNTAHKDSAAL